MDFETLDFEEIRKFCYIEPIEDDHILFLYKIV